MDSRLESLARQIFLTFVAGQEVATQSQKHDAIAHSSLIFESWQIAKEWIASPDEINIRWITSDCSSELDCDKK